MTSINVQQALDKLEVIHRYNKIIDNPHNQNTQSKNIAKGRADREYRELYRMYDGMTEEEKKEMEKKMGTYLEGTRPPKREVGEVWKEDRKWKVKLPRGIHTVETKKRAEAFSRSCFNQESSPR